VKRKISRYPRDAVKANAPRRCVNAAVFTKASSYRCLRDDVSMQMFQRKLFTDLRRGPRLVRRNWKRNNFSKKNLTGENITGEKLTGKN